MSAPWWTRERRPEAPARMVAGTLSGTVAPQPVAELPLPLLRELRDRIAAFTPEWTRLTADDAGVALVRLFGSQLQPLLERLNRLPEKAFVEFLRIAGIDRLPGTAAQALLAFEASAGARASVLVARGFQAGAQPADGSRGLVIFETERDLWLAPGTLAEVYRQEGRTLVEIDVESGEPFRPFGDRPIAGRALLAGIDADVAPGPFLTLGLGVATAPGSPPPVAVGGLQPHSSVTQSVASPTVLRWEILDGAGFEPAEVVADDTVGLQRSGTVELRVPRQWRAGRPAGIDGDAERFWVRLRIVHGRFDEPPELKLLRLNMVRAAAAETVRGEVLEHVPGSEDRMRLARTPVVPGSLVLEIVEGSASGDLFDLDDSGAGSGGAAAPTGDGAAGDGRRRWTEVSDLTAYGPTDRVYTLDAARGEVAFGDGVRGAALPSGFRHVQAASYRVGGGAAGAVAAGEIKTLISSAPFVTGVENPLPATGGTDPEPRDQALRRGPQEIRARGRAVTEADYELLALRSPGADVARAHAVSGLHPSLSGTPIPGLVGVFVVPRDRDEGPPTADEGCLRAVAEYLSREAAPAGVEVVAAAPRYHRVRAEVGVVVSDPAADVGAAVRRVLAELDLYFDPLSGGEDGTGWPFGGAIRYMPLLRRILARVAEVAAVPRLNLVVDEVRVPACQDASISPHGLLWPAGHEVVPTVEESP